MIWELAWLDKGMYLNLTEVPSDIMDSVMEWTNERLREEADAYEGLR